MSLNPTSLAEYLMYITVKINLHDTIGNRTGSGTGFYFDYVSEDGRVMPLIVTNRHVVEGEWGNSFKVHTAVLKDGNAIPSGVSEDVILGDIQKHWVFHPDPSVDLAILPFLPVQESLSKRGKQVYRKAFTQSNIPSKEALGNLLPNEEIMMVGYPTSLWDEVNNFPFFRRGITATHPAVDFMGRKEFVIDMAVYHGSSGSPVVVCNQSFFPAKDGSLQAGNRLLFLGILHSGAVREIKGKIVQRPVPTSVKEELVFEQMVHIGYVTQASALVELIKGFATSIPPKAVT
jgi:hypothetical protein